ncbi:hypothetical protein [Streptomyces otsuchiensis]|uniref:hypothetical protein n=1 Tax=Streptomyces otsuchiensis TaxID=2681388 RepID=UPI00103129CA|nr:hypothetical protein [Streptomyces otsuchiensis]
MTDGGDGAVRVLRYVGGPHDELEERLPPGEDPGDGGYLVVAGWEERAVYEPEPGGDPLLWHYRGPIVV